MKKGFGRYFTWGTKNPNKILIRSQKRPREKKHTVDSNPSESDHRTVFVLYCSNGLKDDWLLFLFFFIEK